jgi:hypothetical protein
VLGTPFAAYAVTMLSFASYTEALVVTYRPLAASTGATLSLGRPKVSYPWVVLAPWAFVSDVTLPRASYTKVVLAAFASVMTVG